MNPRISYDALREFRREFGNLEATRAVRNALNDVLPRAAVEVSRVVRQTYNVQASRVKKAVKTQRATSGNLTAYIFANNAPLPLYSFGARQGKKGVTVKVRQAGGRKLVYGRDKATKTFITQVAAGSRGRKHRGVFERFGNKVVPTRGAYKSRRIKRGPRRGQRILRQPIRELFSVSLAHMLQSKESQRRVVDFARDQYPVALARRITQRIARLRNK